MKTNGLLSGVLLVRLVIGALLIFCHCRTAIGQSEAWPAVAEIEALKAPYLRNLAAIRASRDLRTEPITRAHVAALERMEKESTARGDVTAVPSIQAERERVQAGEKASTTERAAMGPPLLALRERYEKDLERIAVPFLQQELQQTRQYVSALDTVQRRLTAQNQITKAALVAAERASVAPAVPVKETERPSKPVAESTVRATGKLDPALADKIAAALKAKAFTKTESSSGPGEQKGGTDIPEAGGLLVGFEFMEVNNKNGPRVRSLRPYFMTRDGVVAGDDRGKMERVTEKVMARNGYAVAGLLASGEKGALQVIFMKIDPVTGRFDASPASTYKSAWFGTKSREKPIQVGGTGALVIGVYGKAGADCDSMGLIEMQ